MVQSLLVHTDSVSTAAAALPYIKRETYDNDRQARHPGGWLHRAHEKRFSIPDDYWVGMEAGMAFL